MDWNNESFAPQGWQCPICKRVFSPTTPWCYFCGGEMKTVTTTNLQVEMPKVMEFVNEWTGERYPIRGTEDEK